MRMASALATLLAVVCSAVADAGDVIANVSRARRSAHIPRFMKDEEPVEMAASWKRRHWHEMQTILRTEGSGGRDVECCPSVLEMVTMKGGLTPKGDYVELYEDSENKQLLYEVSCLAGVADQPCRFVDARLYNESRCIQKYSYSYALVRHVVSTATKPELRTEGKFSVPGSGGWSMDYVKVRSGCECQIKPTKQRRRHKQKKRNRRVMENDET